MDAAVYRMKKRRWRKEACARNRGDDLFPRTRIYLGWGRMRWDEVGYGRMREDMLGWGWGGVEVGVGFGGVGVG